MKIKLTKEDIKFSEITRRRAQGYCEYCKRWYGWKHLQTSHFKGRRNKIVRCDPDNVAAVCFTCHNTLGENPDTHTEWFKKRLGVRYEQFILHANVGDKPDTYLLNLWLDKELKKVRELWDEPDHAPSLGNEEWINGEYQRFLTTPHKKNMTFKEWLARKIKDRR